MHAVKEQTQKSDILLGGIALIAIMGLIYTGIASCFTGETRTQTHKTTCYIKHS